jgi:hypothetical protein
MVRAMWMRSAQLTAPRLRVRGELPGMRVRAVRAVRPPGRAVVSVAADPGVHGLAGDPVAAWDLNHRRAD